VAHACNPSYSGGRGQEDLSAQANSSERPYLKKPSQKRTGGVAHGLDPEFKPQYQEEKNENEDKHGSTHHNPSTREAEAGESQIKGQPELHSETLSQKTKAGAVAEWQSTCVACVTP
jgi:hypothetical protein